VINSLLSSTIRRSYTRWIPCALVATLAVAAGCANSVTFSRDTRAQGIAHFNAGNHSEAAAAFRAAIQQDPRDYRAHYYLGATYEQMGLHQQAIQSYKSSLDIMRLTHEGRHNVDFRVRVLDGLAGAVARSDDRQMELDILERQAWGGANAESYFVLAKTYRYSGDVDSALQAYHQAAVLDSRHIHIVKEYALYLDQLGLHDRSVPMLRRGFALNPNDMELDAALRRHGIVPGLSLRDEHELAMPPVPKGPVHVRTFRQENRIGQPVLPSRDEQTVHIPQD
jgi:tetratricopeptide (TPR) repeat protein